MRLHLLDEPVLAPSWQVNFRLSRLVRDQIERFGQVVPARSNYLMRAIHEDAADVVGLPSYALPLNSIQFCLLVL